MLITSPARPSDLGAPDPHATNSPEATKPGPLERVEVLVPDSSVQFFDAIVSEDAAARVAARYFECRDEQADGDGISLHQVTLDENGSFHHPITHEIENPDQTYLVAGRKALEAFAGAWLPVPYMRTRINQGGEADTEGLDEGPSNWARIYIARDPGSAAFRLVLAVDTAIETDATGRAGIPTGPTPKDRADGATFRFSADVNDIDWFVTEPWVDEWLTEAYREGRRAQAPAEAGRPDGATIGPLEHLSHYLTLLAVCQAADCLPRLQLLAPPGGGARKPVPVDLVLDIGASRTCALLAEPGRSVAGIALGAPAAITHLPLRDLTRPWQLHSGLFSSRIEFSRAVLGKDVYSRWSGRSSAFFWPSLARVGEEAARLACEQSAADAFTGVSSPLHYLWDEQPSRHVWRFSSAGTGPGGGSSARRNPLISGPLLAHLSETGDVLPAGDKRVGTTKPRFARSALLTFFAAELIVQAIGAINAPAYRAARGRSNVPRHLARVLVTLPTTLQEVEIAILRRRLQDAVRLVGLALGWREDKDAHGQPVPKVEVVADAASCSQIAYLDNEIGHKFRGKARAYFDLIGKARHGHGTSRSVRIATLDIGGGSTSLAVTTYVLDDGATITGMPHLIEGFRIGGDDVAKALIESFVLPAIERQLVDCKLIEARTFLYGIVTGAIHGRASRLGEFRRRFAGELAMPAAIALLNAHVWSRATLDDQPIDRSLGELLADGRHDPRAAADELESLASDEGADGFMPLETRITFALRDVAAITRRVLTPVLSSAMHAIRALDCDVVLLSGWMSRLPVLRDSLLEGMPIRPDRICAMHDYRMGPWYPTAGPATATPGSIGDPKSLPAVGAILLRQPAVRIGTYPLVLQPPDQSSRASFIGRLGPAGLIAADGVLFDSRCDGDASAATANLLQATLSAEPPVVIGMRRAPLESWPALPIYVLALEEMTDEARPRLPLRVTLEWDKTDRSGLQPPRIARAVDADGIDLAAGEITLRLRTLGAHGGSGNGHWLDTGVLAIA